MPNEQSSNKVLLYPDSCRQLCRGTTVSEDSYDMGATVFEDSHARELPCWNSLCHCHCATVLEDRYTRVLLSRNTAIPGPTVIEDRYPGVCSTVLLYKS